jgi:hypothetical protein
LTAAPAQNSRKASGWSRDLLINCARCGNPFHPDRANYRKGKGRLCSHKCAQLAARGRFAADYCEDTAARRESSIDVEPRGMAGGLADAASASGPEQRREPGSESRRGPAPTDAAECGEPCRLAGAESRGLGEQRSPALARDLRHANGGEQACRLGEPIVARLEGHAGHGDDGNQSGRIDETADRPITAPSAIGFWSDFDFIACRDGKARRIAPGSFPLAHGIPARVVRLRGYGNAIVPQVAATFIEASIEAMRDLAQESEAA